MSGPTRRATYVTAHVRANVLRNEDTIFIDGQWRQSFEVWDDDEFPTIAPAYADDPETLAFLQQHLGAGLYSYVVVRYHVEKPGAVEHEDRLIAFRSCDLVPVQQPQLPAAAVAALVLAGFDWTDPTAVHQLVTQLPAPARTALAEAIASAELGEYQNQIIDTIRAGLTEDHEDGDPEPIGVLFRSYGYAGAWYVDNTGTVLFADGTTDERNFGPRMAELMTMRFGRTRPNFVVIVNLANADVDGDEHGEDADIHHLLGVARPAVSTPTNDNA